MIAWKVLGHYISYVNRVTGVCAAENLVTCPGAPPGGDGGTPTCPPGETVDIEDPADCAAFFTCINGDNMGGGTCFFDDHHFNPASGLCEPSANRDPQCALPPPVTAYKKHVEIRTAPHIKKASVADRFLRKLHLRN